MSKISTITEVRKALAKKSVIVDCGGLKVLPQQTEVG